MDLGQKNLFGDRVIKSIGFDETQMIKDILHLHAKGNFIDADVTYSIGNFYKNKLPQPKYKFDLYPQKPDVVKSSADNLPLKNNELNVLMFDPPFLIGKSGQCENSKMARRFSIFGTKKELLDFYKSSLLEFHRVVKKGGIVIFKNQDVITTSNKQVFTHCFIHEYAINSGFYVKDLFILLAKQRLNNPNHKQAHARKYHSYYYVLVAR